MRSDLRHCSPATVYCKRDWCDRESALPEAQEGVTHAAWAFNQLPPPVHMCGSGNDVGDCIPCQLLAHFNGDVDVDVGLTPLLSVTGS